MFCQPKPNHCMKPITTQVLPAQVHPTKQNVVEKTCVYIVPEVYPTHTTNVTNHVYKHVNSFPHTQSNSETITNQQFTSPSAPVAGASFGPQAGGPGGYGGGAPVAGAMMGGYHHNHMGPTMGAMGPMHGPKHHKHCGCGCNRR